jgi:hypothetical protein
MSESNTPNGACGMPQKQPQQAGPNVLPLGRTTGAVTPSAPAISPAQPVGPQKADYQ